jgi:uncharacterized protein (TIGR03437 family)
MKNLPLAVVFLTTALLGTAAGQGPTIRVVNSASFLTDDLSPGSLISITGTNLSALVSQSPDQQTPFTVLNGVSVKIGNTPVGLFYISPSQINGIIDPSTPAGTASLTVITPVQNVSTTVNIQQTAAPALFSAAGAGDREGNILNSVTYTPGPFSVTTGGVPTVISLYLTSLDLTTAPTVTIGGLAAPVQFYGPAACCLGFEQIDVQVPAALAGAGRVDVIVSSGGRQSNAVELLALPNVGQGPFPPAAENTARAREIGAIAYVQALGVTLVLDEADDVIRVIDMKQRAVTGTIALAGGAQPFAIAVNDAGTQAVVAERGRARVAFIDLGRGVVITELPAGSGPSAVAIDGDQVLVTNEDSDTVSIFSLALKQVLGTVPVGRSPRGVAIDDNTSLAYVANQNSGTVSVVDIARRAVVDTLTLGAGARPQNVRVIPPGGMLAVMEPDAGVVDLFDLTSKTKFSARMTATDVVFQRGNAYLANQVGAMAQTAPLNTGAGGINLGAATNVAVDAGARAIAVDSLNNLWLVSSEASGTLALIDLSTNQVTGTINAVRGEGESTARNDRSDRDRAANTPVIVSMVPAQAAAGTTVQIAVNGRNVGGTFDVYFAAPDGSRDPAFAITAMDVDPGGGQVRLTVQIAAGAASGNHLLRVLTPNGENNLAAASGNVLTIP